jgi:threonine-phosphate decarboxylase
MPETVRTAAEQAISLSVHYPDPEYRVLRETLAERENALLLDGEISPYILPQHIICGNGAAELMFALAAARKPQKALLAVPSFFEYEQALGILDCEICHYYMKKEDEFSLGEAFLDAVEAGTDVIVLGNPNNPTGRILEKGFLEQLLKLCRRKNILLVLDESFFDFLCEQDQAQTFSGVSKILEYPNLFVLKSFTKMYAMPGLRFGYGICSDIELLKKMRLVMQPWNVSIPAQEAACAAAGELAFARESAHLVSQNRAAVKKDLEQSGYRVFPSGANFLLLEGDEHLKEICLEHGFLIRDCSNFPGLSKGFFRICIRSEEENRELLQVLAGNDRIRGEKRWQK